MSNKQVDDADGEQPQVVTFMDNNLNRTTGNTEVEENLLSDEREKEFQVFRGAYKNSVLQASLKRSQKMSFRESLMLMPADGDENLTQKEQASAVTVCKVKLQPGIKPINLFSYYYMRFILKMIMAFVQSFISFILVDPDIYNVSESHVGTVAGQLASIGNLVNILFNPVMSATMDLKGRKVPVVSCYLIAGTSIFLMPFFRHVVPAMTILRPLVQFGILAGMIAPLHIDYADKNSIPVVVAQQMVFETLAQALTQGGVLELFAVTSTQFVYHLIGIIVILSAVFLAFGIRDIYKERMKEAKAKADSLMKRTAEPPISRCERVGAVFKRLCGTIRAEPSLPVSMIGVFASASIQVCSNQFGILLLISQYQDNDEARSFAQSWCSILTLVAGFSTIPLYFLVNFCAKNIGFWKTGVILTILILTFEGLFVWQSWSFPVGSLPVNDHGDSLQNFCFVMILILLNLQYLVHIATVSLVAKMDASNRGMVQGASAICLSLGNFSMNLIGGALFDTNHTYPFLMNMGEYTILLIAFLILGPLGKLRF